MAMLAAPAPSSSSAATVGAQRAQVKRILAEMKRLDAEVSGADLAVNAVEARLASANQALTKTGSTLELTSARLEQRQAMYDNRIRQIYQQGPTGVLEVLFGTQTFEDLLTRLDYLGRIGDNDADLVNSIRTERLRLEQLRTNQEQDKRAIQTMRTYRQKQLYLLQSRRAKMNALYRAANANLRRLIADELRRAALARQRNRYPDLSPDAHVKIVAVSISPYGDTYYTSERHPKKYSATGKKWSAVASWYSYAENGDPTASGERFNESDFTAAHLTLPFNTYLAVSFQGKHIVVRINDRGPYVPGRGLDLSLGAARFLGVGLDTVEIEGIVPASK